MKVKYVMFDGAYPVLLSAAHQHAEVKATGTPTSAGFCSFQPKPGGGWDVRVWGESLSLNLVSEECDALFLAQLLE